MEIKDLTQDIYEHSLSLAYSQDLPEKLDCIYVGWLGATVPAVNHSLPPEFIEALKHFATDHDVDLGALGYHLCEICNSHENRGEFLIEIKKQYYVLPQMVLHYIDDHGYRPPKKFVDELVEDWAQPHRLSCRQGCCQQR